MCLPKQNPVPAFDGKAGLRSEDSEVRTDAKVLLLHTFITFIRVSKLVCEF